MSGNINSKTKLVRIILASTVGSLLWAGCAQPKFSVMDPNAIAHAPVDLLKRRPDTHPEFRSGIWQMTPRSATANVIVSPNIRNPNIPPGTVDSTALLVYSPEVVNAVPPEQQEAIIIEAAGAERPAEPRRTWRERWSRKSAPSEPRQRIHEQQEKKIIERPINSPPAENYKPSRDEIEEDDSSKPTTTYFVRE